MFDKNDFINWVETAQKDNTTMQDFRSYHSNPMKQVNEGWGTVVKKGAPLVAKGAKAVVPIVTSAAKEVGQGAAIGAGMAGIRKATDIVKKKLKRQEPDEVQEQPGEHATYETRKELNDYFNIHNDEEKRLLYLGSALTWNMLAHMLEKQNDE